MNKTLYVSDLDGTLLQSGGVLSDFARNTLNELIADGLPFTIATGRQILSVQEVLAGLELRLPVVEKDGAFVSNFHTGEHYVRRDIRRETAVSILQTITDAGLAPFINSTDNHRDKLCYAGNFNAGSQLYLNFRKRLNDPRLEEGDLLRVVETEHTVGFIVIGEEGSLDALYAQLMTQFHDELSGYVQPTHLMPGWHWMAIHHEQAQKSHGIRALQQMTGMTDVELVVFGDQNNDLPMIQAADRGYAMGNADASVKEVATAVIGPNSADSVARFILEEVKG